MKCSRLLALCLAVLVVVPCFGDRVCSRCNKVNTGNWKTMRGPYKAGQNNTPVTRIGVKQSFVGEVEKVSDGDTIWVKVEGQCGAVE